MWGAPTTQQRLGTNIDTVHIDRVYLSRKMESMKKRMTEMERKSNLFVETMFVCILFCLTVAPVAARQEVTRAKEQAKWNAAWGATNEHATRAKFRRIELASHNISRKTVDTLYAKALFSVHTGDVDPITHERRIRSRGLDPTTALRINRMYEKSRSSTVKKGGGGPRPNQTTMLEQRRPESAKPQVKERARRATVATSNSPVGSSDKAELTDTKSSVVTGFLESVTPPLPTP